MDFVIECKKQFDEMMASKGQPDHEYHLENYQCLALNITPQMLDEIIRLRAEVERLSLIDPPSEVKLARLRSDYAIRGVALDHALAENDQLRAEIERLRRVRDAAEGFVVATHQHRVSQRDQRAGCRKCIAYNTLCVALDAAKAE